MTGHFRQRDHNTRWPGSIVACAEARPILVFLAATPFVASDWLFDFWARLSQGRPGFFCRARRHPGRLFFPENLPADNSPMPGLQDRYNCYSVNEAGEE